MIELMFSPFGCSFPRSAGCLIGCFAYSAPVVVNCVQPGLQVGLIKSSLWEFPKIGDPNIVP